MRNVGGIDRILRIRVGLAGLFIATDAMGMGRINPFNHEHI